jgi:fibro-slime domain-containing protein
LSRARLTLVLVALVAGCHAAETSTPDADPGAGGGADVDAGAADANLLVDPTDAGVMFIDADRGAYGLGSPLAISASSDSSARLCNAITGVVRDFKGALPANGGMAQAGGHPDFEVFEGQGVTPGLVAPLLGPDRRPQYTGICELGAPVSATCPNGAMTTTADHFHDWYHSKEGVNIPYLVYFELGPPELGVSTFESSHFFPLDDAGFGNSGTDTDGTPHNFSFTTEIHTTFRYQGGETFTFEGDDDVWIFINDRLAVDLGGLHVSTKKSVTLDASAAALAITTGVVYKLDLFHAERHGVNSDFRIDLNFKFESCGYIVP